MAMTMKITSNKKMSNNMTRKKMMTEEWCLRKPQDRRTHDYTTLTTMMSTATPPPMILTQTWHGQQKEAEPSPEIPSRVMGAVPQPGFRRLPDNQLLTVHHDMRSHTGGSVYLGMGAIYSAPNKHNMNTKISTEYELVGVNELMPQIIWMLYFGEAQGFNVT